MVAAFTPNRQGFSHREADAKSLLDEVLRRGRGSVDGWAGGSLREDRLTRLGGRLQ